jgi:amino acid permease
MNIDDAFFRAEIVIGAIVAAYGMLVWRSASRKLSLANYVIVVSCVAVLLQCVSKQSEWVYFLNHQRGFLTLNDLKILVIDITIPVCIVVFGGWGPIVHTRTSGFADTCDPVDSAHQIGAH